ncbi:MAG: hypothetical protein AAGK00_06310 [Pseudomonadota bacterium]
MSDQATELKDAELNDAAGGQTREHVLLSRQVGVPAAQTANSGNDWGHPIVPTGQKRDWGHPPDPGAAAYEPKSLIILKPVS